MADPVRIAIAGAAGRMGRALVSEARDTPGLVLSAAVARPGSAAIGVDVGTLAQGKRTEVHVSDALADVLGAVDVVVDFTDPATTLAHAQACAEAGVALVAGTTGFDDEALLALEVCSTRVPIVRAPNFSVGVNLTLRLLRLAAQVLDDAVDVEVVEMHHGGKLDAPSGTALALGEAVASARGVSLDAVAEHGRSGLIGAREPGRIGFHALRGGDVVGDHTVVFASAGERIEISHKASSRATFAAGALRAARWVSGRAPGAYDMQDVLA